MEMLKTKNYIYPMLGFCVAILTLVIGLIFVENESIMYFYIGLFLLHILFGNACACIAIIPFLVIMASFFGGATYIVAHDMESTRDAVFRSFAVCFAMIPGLSIPTTAFVKNLRQMKIPKGMTLGLMITLNFIPLFQKEMKQIRDAMKTRGAVSIFNPRVIYRAFLIPLIIRIVNISETLSLSVETRGFTLEPSDTTVYQPIPFRRRDVLFLISFIVLVIGVIV